MGFSIPFFTAFLDQCLFQLYLCLRSVLTDVINDALDGCSIADLIESGSCFREGFSDKRKLGISTLKFS